MNNETDFAKWLAEAGLATFIARMELELREREQAELNDRLRGYLRLAADVNDN